MPHNPPKAAKEATTSIPIVFGAAGDPVGQKFVGSLAQPGGNISGTFFDADPEMTTKQIHLLVDTIPNVGRVAFCGIPPFLLFAHIGRPLRTPLQHCAWTFNLRR